MNISSTILRVALSVAIAGSVISSAIAEDKVSANNDLNKNGAAVMKNIDTEVNKARKSFRAGVQNLEHNMQASSNSQPNHDQKNKSSNDNDLERNAAKVMNNIGKAAEKSSKAIASGIKGANANASKKGPGEANHDPFKAGTANNAPFKAPTKADVDRSLKTVGDNFNKAGANMQNSIKKMSKPAPH